jgi:NADH-quinone oxidoreductase subunit G
MPAITIDDKQIEVQPGATVMDAANQLGIYIPHFCYHKKLSIAANCRMCLVEVAKAHKPLPACATPVTDGMVVRTHSARAIEAQKGVMELLLINHPLDCPICDQGGECQLQDLAVGYGGSRSRYSEEKRVVRDKNLGPLISTDMTRCIHCSRCVRFGQEIAGVMELGMPGRGEHTEVMAFLERQIGSELSGNVIDLCPVGALTSKPFRYTARTWELTRRKSVSPHDGLGANLQVHVKDRRVFRVLPRENEAINECWLPDRDRFSYQGLNSEERLTRPMVRQGDGWVEVDWQKALAQAAGALRLIRDTHGGESIGVLGSPHQTVEELYLLQGLARGLGCENVDHGIGRAAASAAPGVPWLGMPIADLERLDRVLLVGSTLRKDQPLVAHRLREAVKRCAQLNVVHAAGDDLLCKVNASLIVRPSALVQALARVAKALQEGGASLPAELAEQLAGVEADEEARDIARSLATGKRKAVLLGSLAQQHPAADALQALAEAVARASGATLGVLVPAANGVGAGVVNCRPGAVGLDAAGMFAQPRQAYLLLGTEPDLDAYDSFQARRALESAELVVALTAFRTRVADYAQVMLPIAPYTETGGAFVNMEGRLQTFQGTVPPLGETRPAWKVLRVLGNLLHVPGFDYDSVEAVRAAALPQGEAGIGARLDNAAADVRLDLREFSSGLERLGETPIYQLDPLVRRAPALQATTDAEAAATCRASGAVIERLGLSPGTAVKVIQDGHEAVLPLERDDHLADGVVRVAGSHPLTAGLGPRLGGLNLERV